MAVFACSALTLVACKRTRDTLGAQQSIEHIEIGTRPPGFKIALDPQLSPLSVTAKLDLIRSTCSCLSVSLEQGGQTVPEDGMVSAGNPLRAKILFSPKGRLSRIDDTISFLFKTAEGIEATRIVRITGALDPKASIVEKRSEELALMLPDQILRAQVPLRRLCATNGIGFPKVPWLSIAPIEGKDAAQTACLELKLGPFSKPQEKSFTLTFPQEDGGSQVFPMTLRVQAPERFEPTEVVLRLDEGSEVTKAVELVGNNISAKMRSDLRWATEKDSHIADIRSEIVRPETSKDRLMIRLRVRTLAAAGSTESCRLEFLPREGSPYWLILPILIHIRKDNAHD